MIWSREFFQSNTDKYQKAELVSVNNTKVLNVEREPFLINIYFSLTLVREGLKPQYLCIIDKKSIPLRPVLRAFDIYRT